MDITVNYPKPFHQNMPNFAPNPVFFKNSTVDNEIHITSHHNNSHCDAC
jgi:hypothetical protein